jgi:hypothetical protein
MPKHKQPDYLTRVQTMLDLWVELQPTVISKEDKTNIYWLDHVWRISINNTLTACENEDWNNIYVFITKRVLERDLISVILPSQKRLFEFRILLGEYAVALSGKFPHIGIAALDAYVSLLWYEKETPSYLEQFVKQQVNSKL